jgi:hypothetical protein
MTVLILILCKLLYTREEAAEFLNLSLRKLDELVALGALKPRRIDNAVRFYVGELVRFADPKTIESNCDDNASEVPHDRA